MYKTFQIIIKYHITTEFFVVSTVVLNSYVYVDVPIALLLFSVTIRVNYHKTHPEPSRIDDPCSGSGHRKHRSNFN